MTKTEKMDRKDMLSADQFISEVIGILRIEKLHIDISVDKKILNPVRIEFVGSTIDNHHFETVCYGRAIGEAFRKIREEIRERVEGDPQPTAQNHP